MNINFRLTYWIHLLYSKLIEYSHDKYLEVTHAPITGLMESSIAFVPASVPLRTNNPPALYSDTMLTNLPSDLL